MTSIALRVNSGQLVEKEHAMMGERYLAGLRERSAADEGGLTDRVVRKTKRPRPHDARATDEQSGHAVNFRHLERFLQRHRWKNRWKAPREHRLAAARRSDEQKIVTAGGRDLEGALGGDLTAHVGQIAMHEFVGKIEHGSGRVAPPFRAVPREHRDRRLERIDGIELDIGDERGFVGVERRNDQLCKAGVARRQEPLEISR